MKKISLTNFTEDKNGFICNENYSLGVSNFIYKLTNIINNKIYIGKTERTLKQHLQRYNKENKTKRYIQKALKKYGLNNFIFEILEICDKENLNQREKYYIKLFNSNINEIGYNLTEGGEGTTGYHHTEESIKNRSLMKGKFTGEKNGFFNKKHTQETIKKIIESNKRRGGEKSYNNPKKSKPVIQLDISNNKINEFKSLSEAERKTGIDAGNISKVCKGVYKQSNGFIWKYKEL